MKFSDWYELREQKDACYYKVKATASVWPSAYASGRLVQCRKKGAKNWGKSKKKKKHMIAESLKDKQQYSDAVGAAMALYYKGMDASKMSNKEIVDALVSLGKRPSEDISMQLFAARIKSVSREQTLPDDFNEGTFDLEKSRGLRGWFDRNKGKGWIDCKASKKGKLVPCGRKKTGRGADRAYPACRPNLSACNKKGVRRKKGEKKISWK